MPTKILVADQSETVRGIAENLFRKKGFEVVSAADGIEALELVRTAGVDLAFLNSSLPEIDGYSTSKQIKSDENTRNVKTVLLLSTSEMVDQHRLLTSLADDTINKPFSPQDLMEIASAALNIEIENTADEAVDPAESGVIGDDIEEIGLDKTSDDEIDFSSIFGDEEPGDEESRLDRVFLSDENIDDSTGGPVTGTPVIKETEMSGGNSHMSGKTAGEADDKIRLADDQYGLGTSRPEMEVEPPHDYNWFIREMKKDLTKSEQSKFSGPEAVSASTGKGGSGRPEPATPGKPTGRSTSGTHFAIEEIGMSGTPIGFTEPQDGVASGFDEEVTESAGKDRATDRLSLAEKLLVRELASRIAEKLVERLSKTELRQIIADALSSLRKM